MWSFADVCLRFELQLMDWWLNGLQDFQYELDLGWQSW
jgi:hypothetical protein